jgi:hypothetical protein
MFLLKKILVQVYFKMLNLATVKMHKDYKRKAVNIYNVTNKNYKRVQQFEVNINMSKINNFRIMLNNSKFPLESNFNTLLLTEFSKAYLPYQSHFNRKNFMQVISDFLDAFDQYYLFTLN